jgi:hypothetical protein
MANLLWVTVGSDQIMQGKKLNGALIASLGEELRHVGAQVLVRKASSQKTEHQQRVESCLHD